MFGLTKRLRVVIIFLIFGFCNKKILLYRRFAIVCYLLLCFVIELKTLKKENDSLTEELKKLRSSSIEPDREEYVQSLLEENESGVSCDFVFSLRCFKVEK